MLTIPVHQPFTGFKSSFGDSPNILPAGKDSSRRFRASSGDVCHRKATGRCTGGNNARKGLIMFASARDRPDAVPLNEVGNALALGASSASCRSHVCFSGRYMMNRVIRAFRDPAGGLTCCLVLSLLCSLLKRRGCC